MPEAFAARAGFFLFVDIDDVMLVFLAIYLSGQMIPNSQYCLIDSQFNSPNLIRFFPWGRSSDILYRLQVSVVSVRNLLESQMVLPSYIASECRVVACPTRSVMMSLRETRNDIQ